MQEQSSSLTILGFFFTIFLNFLQLKYQGTDPFSTHPKTMRLSVTSLLLYSLIYAIKHRFSSHPIYRKFSDLIHNVMVFFTCLSLASTVSLLFPDSVSPLLYFLCFLFTGAEMLLWVFEKIKQEWYFQTRRNGELIWNYLTRRTNMVFYPMEHNFRLPV
ncbi:hypothetical protein MTR67_036943 [Solanum verrucosum]|uniref:Uncharacterized protein n=1 Tax=Solanum verrucosum TaxID=315347 RepID=A0AAF0UCZ1_SOLVR|nr:hypothetical protein MTR67_036943 [Solanum verrucosum]